MAVPQKLAEQYKEQMDRGSVVFLNEENADRLKPRIPEEIWNHKKQELDQATMEQPS